MKIERCLKEGKDFVLMNRHFGELNPLAIGHEHCAEGHSFGPYVRKYVLIHYIVSGKGTVEKNGRIYSVKAGEAFIILPEEIVTYRADNADPWYYVWVGFDGSLAARFAELPAVLPFPSDPMLQIVTIEDTPMREYRIAGILFALYADLFEGRAHKHHYVRRVEDYIRTLYMQPLRVEEIAKKMNLDRRYLSRIFKAKTGMTIQDYIVTVRMEEAKARLAQGLSIEETALFCGYEDSSNFSKMFKRKFGISPLYWKNQNS